MTHFCAWKCAKMTRFCVVGRVFYHITQHESEYKSCALSDVQIMHPSTLIFVPGIFTSPLHIFLCHGFYQHPSTLFLICERDFLVPSLVPNFCVVAGQPHLAPYYFFVTGFISTTFLLGTFSLVPSLNFCATDFLIPSTLLFLS